MLNGRDQIKSSIVLFALTLVFFSSWGKYIFYLFSHIFIFFPAIQWGLSYILHVASYLTNSISAAGHCAYWIVRIVFYFNMFPWFLCFYHECVDTVFVCFNCWFYFDFPPGSICSVQLNAASVRCSWWNYKHCPEWHDKQRKNVMQMCHVKSGGKIVGL